MKMISNIKSKLLLPVLLIMIFSGCSTANYYSWQVLIDKKKGLCQDTTDRDKNRQCQILAENRIRFIDPIDPPEDRRNNENNSDSFAYENCSGSNYSSENCPFNEEIEYLKDWPPKIGLALSGGGTRAASFHVGVLKALHDSKILKEVDVISSVSGGSYAAYWYFSQNFYQDKVKEYFNKAEHDKYHYDTHNLFRTDQDDGLTNLANPQEYRFQRSLEEGSNILAYTRQSAWHAKAKVSFIYGVETIMQAVSIPVNWITGGVFDWELNWMPYFYNYKDGLERTYGFVPLDYNLGAFANARPGMFFDNIDAEPILLSEMEKFFIKKNSKLPYFIINTTGRPGAALNKKNLKLRTMEDTVFEFTPWGCHSTLLAKNKRSDCPKIIRAPTRFGNGFKDVELMGIKEDLDFSRIVTISGAALDGQAEKLDIAGRGSEFSKLLNKSWTDIGLDFSHMNMGYHLSNTNAPSWQRIFHKILPWPLYLVSDFGFSESSSIYLSDGGHSDNLGLFPLIRRGVKKIIVVDAEEDENSIFEGAKRINHAIEKFGLKLEFKQDKPIHVLNAEHKPFRAYICSNNTKDCSKEFISEIFYIKLSVPGRHSHIAHHGELDLPFTTRKYMEENPRFPHQSTVDVFYDPEQFIAYRDLGYSIAEKLENFEFESLRKN